MTAPTGHVTVVVVDEAKPEPHAVENIGDAATLADGEVDRDWLAPYDREGVRDGERDTDQASGDGLGVALLAVHWT